VTPKRKTQNAGSETQITIFKNSTSKRNRIARAVSKWIKNATRNAISKRNFKTQPQTPPPDDEKAASSEISKRNSLDLIPGCCTKVRRPHGTKTVEIHQICTSGFRTQSERNRNAIKTQQSLILAQIPRTSTNTFPLTCSKYVRHLKVLLFTIDC
jgi:hypothetical protein